jgi:tRNA(fMet)-specific endonuclease VapC
MILFDTDTCIEILRGNKRVLERKEGYRGEIAIGFMTAGELFYGAETSAQPVENRVLVEKFMLSLAIIHTDIPILKRFGEIKAGLKRSGKLLPDADILIAATALERTEALITGNTGHFDRIPGLKLENWIR